MSNLVDIYNNNNFCQVRFNNITVNPLLAYKIGGEPTLLYATLLQLDKEYRENKKLNELGEFDCSHNTLNHLCGLKRGKLESSIKVLVDLNLITCRLSNTNRSKVKINHFSINQDSTVLDKLIEQAYIELTGYDAVRRGGLIN